MDMTIEQAMKVAADLEERGCLNEPAKAARVLLAHINSLASPQVTDEQLLAAFNSAPFGLPGLRAVLSLSAPPAAETRCQSGCEQARMDTYTNSVRDERMSQQAASQENVIDD